jgi:hypothetical protein
MSQYNETSGSTTGTENIYYWRDQENGKVKGKLFLCLMMHLTVKLYEGGGASCPSCFTAKEREPDTHWIESCVGPRAGLVCWKREKPLPLPGIEPIIQPTA